ncbi:alcohol dehydrogenase [Striga asiatica]|uniref:Alcohol dehydrogenase n=1 Tax=Striga asiatica TaxID=4170 RepID=A0A5A7RD72_STRAF|nr:alcohol dehydrogenase [Striga asiatica]
MYKGPVNLPDHSSQGLHRAHTVKSSIFAPWSFSTENPRSHTAVLILFVLLLVVDRETDSILKVGRSCFSLFSAIKPTVKITKKIKTPASMMTQHTAWDIVLFSLGAVGVAAVSWGAGKPLVIEEVDVAPPQKMENVIFVTPH